MSMDIARQKIAIIGTGIAGNVAAWRLAPHHDITVFEADDRIGGHTHTVDVTTEEGEFAVDTGFIVFNDRTYPNFIAVLDELGVAARDSEMSFSVRDERSALEYCGSSLDTLFAQRRNLVRPSFYRMIGDILRFNREAPTLLEDDGCDPTLHEYLVENRYSPEFIEHYIVPMGAAIWSATPDGFRSVPARFLIRFFDNHGLLTLNDRPQWRTISGGSMRYVEKMIAGHRDRIRLNSPVESIRRLPGKVELRVRGRSPEYFDRVFLACHSDQALKMLADPSRSEREVLSAIRYQRNEAVLHTDATLMPSRRRAWASWNYHIPANPVDPDGRVAVTYHMNTLQGIESRESFCVTLNHSEAIDPSRIIRSIDYDHPIFDDAAVAAQRRHREVNGANRTYFCGAYWRYGFHEDGVVSALDALAHLEQDLRDEELYFSRTA
jgi:predicted NAD/FAD-binding protein